tara:strand:- start:617 stop:1051 length:435 start_codon:yes stop_codon:yes gene_type:complete
MIHNLVQLSNSIRNTYSINLCKYFVNRYIGDDWKQFIDYKNKTKLDGMGYSKIKLPINIPDKQLYLLEWEKDALTIKHQHFDKGCLYKVLQGSLVEKLYDHNKEHFNTRFYGLNDISYLNDKKIYHSIENKINNKSYSLHIYEK